MEKNEDGNNQPKDSEDGANPPVEEDNTGTENTTGDQQTEPVNPNPIGKDD